MGDPRADPRFEYSSAETKKVGRVQFGVVGPDEIRAMSVCEVTDATTPFENGVPRENGLMDLRMGTTERMFNCKTCSGNRTECPGHFGHIELAKPVLHPGFMVVTLKILRSVCYHCSALLINSQSPKYVEAMKIKNPAARMRAVSAACAGIKQCNGGIDMDDEGMHTPPHALAAAATACAGG